MSATTRLKVDGDDLLWVSSQGDTRKVRPQCVLQSHLLHELANTSGAAEDALVPLGVHAFQVWIEHIQGKEWDDVPVNKAHGDETDLAHGEQSIDTSGTSAGLGAAAHASRTPDDQTAAAQLVEYLSVERLCHLVVVRTASTHSFGSERRRIRS